MNATKHITVFPGFLLMACLALSGRTAYAGTAGGVSGGIAGHAQFVNGSVQITNAAGKSYKLQKGDAVHESDTVTTARGGSAQIRMRDDGFIAIRPDSQLKFDTFVFAGEQDGKERSFLSLLRGGFRAVTGLIGQRNKANYRIAAGGSTIGIRGTDHETVLVVPGSELAATVPSGTYNKVNTGETTLTTDKGTINILPNQMGFAAAADQMPQLQPINLNIFTVVPSPALQSKAGPAQGAGRESTVVDTVVQEQNMAPASVGSPPPALRPITIDPSGGTKPPVTF